MDNKQKAWLKSLVDGTREVLYRAKQFNGEWVEGFYLVQEPENDGGLSYIYNEDDIRAYYPVFSTTLCQYFGKVDMNNKKIFEHDILQIWKQNPYNGCLKTGGDGLAVCVFRDGVFGYVKIDDPYHFVHKFEKCGLDFNPNEDDYTLFEVIGNIYDNMNLLELKESCDA